ncbi:MAG: hypothetical protein HGB12_13945 [Bacteroidetes bacterium]|nr:hypothetical protein [Bacteroidota bacterium]
MKSSQLARETDNVLGLMGLEAAADRAIRGFSKGMVQRLGVAQTLLHDPDIFILVNFFHAIDDLLDHHFIEGIVYLRPVQPDDAKVSVLFEFYG